MHESNNCENAAPKRTDLNLYSEAIVKVTDSELKWLIPFAEKLSIKTIPLSPKSFTIKDSGREWETIIFIQEEQLGQIRVYGYHPIHCYKKIKAMPQDEEPFFSLTLRFVLGQVKIENFVGKQNKKDVICKDVKKRVLPVILYMQQCKEHATMSTRKITVKIGKKGKKVFQTTYTLKRVENEIPKEFEFAGKKLQVQKPQFQPDLKQFSAQGLVATVNCSDDILWFQTWAEGIRKEAHNCKSANDYPMYNRSLDNQEAEKVAALRAYAEVEDELSFMQLQINKAAENIYQLDYYDEESSDCQMILFVDITEEPSRYDIAYVDGNGEVTAKDDMYARRIATMFVDLLIYLRIYDWEHAKDEDGKFYDVTIEKFPNIK